MLKIKDFLITSLESQNICKNFIPTDQKSLEETAGVSKVTSEDKFGRIFAILKCPDNPENEKLATFLDSAIQKYYQYNQSTTKKITTETIFENFLYDLNNKFQRFLKDEEISINIKKINLLIGLLHKETNYHLYFSQIGYLTSLLIYKNKNGESNIAQIRESTEVGENKNNSKIFSNIISGKIKDGSTLIFCSNNVLDYIPLDKLRLIAENQEAKETTEEIKKLLLAIDSDRTFCGQIMKVKQDNEIIKPKENKINLFGFAKKTNEEVKPESIKIKDGQVSTIPPISKTLTSDENNNAPKNHIPPIKDTDITIKTVVFQHAGEKQFHPPKKYTILLPYYIIKSIIVNIYKILKYLITGKIFRDTYRQTTRVPGYFRTLPILRKIFLTISIILIIFFIQSVSYLKQQKIKEDNLKYYQELITQIEENKNELEASLIYNSRDKAAAILLTIEDLINKLPQDSIDQKNKLIEIKEQIKELSFKTKLITELKEPKELTDYSKLTESPTTAISLDKKIIYSVTFDNTFYQLNLTDTSVNKVDNNKLTLPEPKLLIDSNLSLIVLHQNNVFSKINKEKKQQNPIQIKFPETNTSIDYASLYGDKLYTLDKTNNQIYKHLTSGEDFSIGKPWLEEDANLSKVISMAIDGNVFVLENNGNISSFFKGKKGDFKFENKNMILTSGSKIWTNSASDNLYVIDNLGKKIAIIDKTGKLKAQYYSEKFTNIKDFAIDEIGKKIYVLADNKIFEIEIQ